MSPGEHILQIIGIVIGLFIFEFTKYLARRFILPRSQALPEPEVEYRTNRGLKPYPKPSGKKTPRVNDDASAWRKEHEN